MRRDVREQVDERLAVARKQSEHHSRRLRILQEEQQKLVQLYYKGGVSEEVLTAEQERIETERTQAHHSGLRLPLTKLRTSWRRSMTL